ncbi:MAG: hypothetical protein AB7P76_05855 [Candidatus Melainabacteria bacterium]
MPVLLGGYLIAGGWDTLGGTCIVDGGFDDVQREAGEEGHEEESREDDEGEEGGEESEEGGWEADEARGLGVQRVRRAWVCAQPAGVGGVQQAWVRTGSKLDWVSTLNAKMTLRLKILIWVTIMNSEFSYQYRDASNYKNNHSIIVEGEISEQELEPFLHESEFFIPSSVGLEDLQSLPLTIEDHVWHTIESIERTEKSATINFNVSELKMKFELASNNEWFFSTVVHEKGMV